VAQTNFHRRGFDSGNQNAIRFWILDFGFWIVYFMNEKEFKDRTKRLALRVIKLVESLPATVTAKVIGKQRLRSATSVGANYRAACRGKSSADVIHKLSIVEEEADESLYWLELLIESGIIPEKKLAELQKEMNEIVAMVVASIKTLRAKQLPIQNPKSKIQN
jgi:four helix bundle protein